MPSIAGCGRAIALIAIWTAVPGEPGLGIELNGQANSGRTVFGVREVGGFTNPPGTSQLADQQAVVTDARYPGRELGSFRLESC